MLRTTLGCSPGVALRLILAVEVRLVAATSSSFVGSDSASVRPLVGSADALGLDGLVWTDASEGRNDVLWWSDGEEEFL